MNSVRSGAIAEEDKLRAMESSTEHGGVFAHLEGDGGRFNNAITIPTKSGLQILSGSKTADIGRLYQWITLLLGMKPYHDE